MQAIDIGLILSTVGLLTGMVVLLIVVIVVLIRRKQPLRTIKFGSFQVDFSPDRDEEKRGQLAGELFQLFENSLDPSARRYRECLDQIERTERMLRLLWREIHGLKDAVSTELIDLYDRLDRRSTSIRENARVIIRNLLSVGS